MSQRHRGERPPLERTQIRARFHHERQRIRIELHAVAGGVNFGGAEPDDIDEPAPAFKATHHHDPERSEREPGRRLRHWKTKAWKRRNAARRARNRRIAEDD